MNKKQIQELIDTKLTNKEKIFYGDYIKFMSVDNVKEFVFYLQHKKEYFYTTC